MLFQIALILFAIIAIARTWKQYSKNEVSKYWGVLFTFLWIVVIVVALIPNLTNSIAHIVGIGRGADVIIYSAIVVLTYTVYQLILREQRMSAEMTELVRAIAIDHAHSPNETPDSNTPTHDSSSMTR